MYMLSEYVMMIVKNGYCIRIIIKMIKFQNVYDYYLIINAVLFLI